MEDTLLNKHPLSRKKKGDHVDEDEDEDDEQE